jgi:ribosome silencing factor RsfS/YbeB/iojap
MNSRVDNIVNIIDEKKGESIEVFDMRDKDYFVDFVVLTTTIGQRHGTSLVDTLKKELKLLDEDILNIEQSENWSVLDLGDILIHLLTPEYRATYNLEEFLTKRESEED